MIKREYHIRVDGLPLIFSPEFTQLPLRLDGDLAEPVNSLLMSLVAVPGRLENTREMLRKKVEQPAGKLRWSFPSMEGWIPDRDSFHRMIKHWQPSPEQKEAEDFICIFQHKCRCRVAWLPVSSLDKILELVEKVDRGEADFLKAEAFRSTQRFRIDGIDLLRIWENGKERIEFSGEHSAAAGILVKGYFLVDAYQQHIGRGGSKSDEGHAFWPLTAPYEDMADNPNFQKMKRRWERKRNRPLAEPVWVSKVSWEQEVFYVAHSTLPRLSALAATQDDLRRVQANSAWEMQASKKQFHLDGFELVKIQHNSLYHEIKFTQPAFSPLNWMLVDLQNRYVQNVEKQLSLLREGMAKLGPGIRYARHRIGSPDLQSPIFERMREQWQNARRELLNEDVWVVKLDWEASVSFIPHSTLEKVILRSQWW